MDRKSACRTERGIVGSVRIVKVYPYKKRRLAILVRFDPADSVTHHLSGAALDTVIAAFIGTSLGMKACVEGIEAAIEARRHVGFGIQDQRTDECRGAITALVQDLRHVRQ